MWKNPVILSYICHTSAFNTAVVRKRCGPMHPYASARVCDRSESSYPTDSPFHQCLYCSWWSHSFGNNHCDSKNFGFSLIHVLLWKPTPTEIIAQQPGSGSSGWLTCIPLTRKIKFMKEELLRLSVKFIGSVGLPPIQHLIYFRPIGSSNKI